MARQGRRKGRRKSRGSEGEPGQLLREGRTRLRDGDARGAIDCLKRAGQGSGPPPGADLVLLGALAARARQLAALGEAREAGLMRQRATELAGTMNPGTLDEAGQAEYLRAVEGATAVAQGLRLLADGGLSEGGVRALADQLVVGRCWEALEDLDPEHALRRDAPVLRQAMVPMDAGAWGAAADRLAGIGRRSPFAAWRVFCKAMACFAAGDDAGVQRALGVLDEGFALAGTVRLLRASCRGPVAGDGAATRRGQAGKPDGDEGSTGEERLRHLLGVQGAEGEGLAAQLVGAVNRGRARDLQKLIPPLAQAVYPEDPAEARVALFEILAPVVARRADLGPALLRAIPRVLPRERAAAVAARIGIRLGRFGSRQSPALLAGQYLDHLEVEFPDPALHALARGRVLSVVARLGHEMVGSPEGLEARELAALWALAGIPAGRPEWVFPSLLRASLEADPGQGAGYLLLAAMLRERRAPHRMVERALTDMRDRFADDPEPCLELARHYYGRNAYRKAEAALRQARQRAPYDERILDGEAVGYLKSADENRKRRRWDLTAADLEKAGALGRPRVAPIVQIKCLALEVLGQSPAREAPCQLDLGFGGPRRGRASAPEQGGAEEPWTRRLEALPPVELLRTLALLLADLEAGPPGPRDEVARQLHARRELLAGLSSAEVLNLLLPVAEEFAPLFADIQVALVLERYWRELLARVGSEHLVAAVDVLLECGGHQALHGDLERRCRQGGEAGQGGGPPAGFCLEVVLQLEGRSQGPGRFEELVAGADAGERAALRAAARQLARHAAEPLRTALSQFDFEVLEASASLFEAEDLEAIFRNESMGPDWMEHDEEEDDDDEVDLTEIVETFEQLIDVGGLRGAPVTALRDLAGSLRSDPPMREMLQVLAAVFESEGDALSRELQVLLFSRPRGGRKGRSRSRKR